MRIDTTKEELKPLTWALRHWVPPDEAGDPQNDSTARRWFRKGLKAANGCRIRLEIVMVGSKPYTSREAVDRFFAALTDACVGGVGPRGAAVSGEDAPLPERVVKGEERERRGSMPSAPVASQVRHRKGKAQPVQSRQKLLFD